MAKRESLRALTVAVAHAEVIPADRPLTREGDNTKTTKAAPAAKPPAAKKRQPPTQKTKNKKSANKLNAELHRISP